MRYYAADQVVLTLKTPWRAATTHLVMSPLEFMQRQIEWQLCGSQVRECYVGNGSNRSRDGSLHGARPPDFAVTPPLNGR
jgi:hypothetical protein